MKLLLFLNFIFFGWFGWTGTSVGNFNKRLQPQFDFRIMYPSGWEFNVVNLWAGQSTKGLVQEQILESWRLDNSKLVPVPDAQSWIQLNFIIGFPAQNDQELLIEAQKRHPNLHFSKSANPDFVGVTSDQIPDGPNATKSYDYIFSEKGKVVEVLSRRHSANYGASQLDMILSTVRRISKPMGILSAEMDKAAGQSYEVGEKYCYFIKLDILRIDSIPSLSLYHQGKQNHRLQFQTKWRPDDGILEYCGQVDASYAREALLLTQLSVSSGEKSVYCYLETATSLKCNQGKDVISLQFGNRWVNNPNPDKDGPRILGFEALGGHTFRLNASDTSGIEWGRIDVITNHGEKISQYLHPSDFIDPTKEINFPEKLLTVGFNRIESVVLMDLVGNVSVLQAHPKSQTYYLIPNSRTASDYGSPPQGQPATPTPFAVGYFRRK